MTTTAKAETLTDERARAFGFTMIFRAGDWAILCYQNAWRCSYSIATRRASDPEREIYWAGSYESLVELLADYSPEIKTAIAKGIDQDERSFAEAGDGTPLDRAQIMVRRAALDFSLAPDPEGPDPYFPAHWDTLDAKDFRPDFNQPPINLIEHYRFATY